MESPAYVFLSVCLFVCYHDNQIKRGRIWTKFFGKVPRGESKPKFVCGYDRLPKNVSLFVIVFPVLL